ncbi:MAG: 30S ribosomal protein S16 [Gemmatimonadetes bacterium]|nr:MAG: 30S ribosomal protein S16 [Gemmatimonadota bacterium]PYP69096.1 MAG: 30S ribosomal protein S16 [Gemmatimonadota bacterium]
MATRIRLRRVGRKGQSYFRIVIADQRAARDGRFVATIGHYNPRTDPAKVEVNAEQALAWLAKGAQPTDTVRSLLKKAGVLGKRPA